MLVVPPFPLNRYAAEGAVGLLVPGSGPTVSGQIALASLLRGKTRNARLGGAPSGPELIAPGGGRAEVTIYVALPPPGERPNDRRYPVAVVGGGFHGILTSTGTRVPGLVSVADVAPAAVALSRGKREILGSRSGDVGDLTRLEARFEDLEGSRGWVLEVLVAGTLALAAVALPRRSPVAACASLLAGSLALAGTLALSALGVAGSLPVAATVALLIAVAGPALARALPTPARLGLALVALLAVELVVLVAWPRVAALSPLGPHPETGGRFYGVTNRVETLLLVPALAAATLLGRRWLPAVGALALVTVGWSHAGADGGGIVVLGVGLLVLWLRLGDVRVTITRLPLLAAAAAGIGLLVVGADALTGGSSHVTETVGGGPDELADRLGDRIHLSYLIVTSSATSVVLFAVALAGLVWLASRRPRGPLLDALLAALAVSLLVNDAPNDVVRLGLLSATAVWAWQRVEVAAPRDLL